MIINGILGLLGGLALFLYGMQMMSSGLEDAAGNRMKQILEKLTSNRFLGILVGALITIAIQSSSATTVMVVGFVNSGLLSLTQAVWIIMGANIGTTVTGQLIALDVGVLAPIFAIVGVVMVVFLKNPKIHPIGKILAGLGVLFIGMNLMGDSMVPFRESEAFISLMTRFDNPLLGIVAGALFTAVIQSSAASIGILQTLAVSGIIPFSSAVYILFGQNIGTCITAVLASFGANRNAKRTTIIHLLFNVIGTVIFTVAFMFIPAIGNFVVGLSPAKPATQIANMHTIFNIVTTVLLIPFGTLLAKLAVKILPEKETSIGSISSLAALNEEFRRGSIKLGATAIHTELLSQEIKKIVTLAGKNACRAFNLILKDKSVSLEKIKKRESEIDVLNKELSQYVSKILVTEKSASIISDIEQYFLITGNAERIGDHAINIAEYDNIINEKKIEFSEGAKTELRAMRDVISSLFGTVLSFNSENDDLLKVAQLEQKMDDMTVEYREKHLERMKQGLCSEEACVLYSEMLTDFERIGDHFLNIAQAYSKIR